jgi:hypothetical protein
VILDFAVLPCYHVIAFNMLTHERTSMANGTKVKTQDTRSGGRRSMINLTKEQHEWARLKAFEKNQSIASVIRAAIDEAMKTKKIG